MESVASTFQAAMRCHNAGDLRQAEQLYRRVLGTDPRHAHALHMLGLLAYQVGKHDAAVQMVSGAIRVDGGQAVFHTTLAEAYRSLGKMNEAIVCYRQALRLKPDYAEAHNNLGTLLQAQGDIAAAMACYREAFRLVPAYAEAHHNLGFAYQQQGQWDEAARAFSEAIRVKPDYQASQMALAGVLQAQGRTDEAVALFETLARGQPHSAQAQCALGAGYHCRGDYARAEACYRRAIAIEPGYAEAHYNLGVVLQLCDRDAEAIAAFHEALRYKPELVPAWSSLAGTYLGLVRPDEAVAAARKALELAPLWNAALSSLAAALQMQGDMDGAIAAFRRCVELQPADEASHSSLVYSLNFHPGLDAAALFAEHRAWAERHAEGLTHLAPPHDNDRTPERRLRVGYVSAHFRNHAVAFFSEPMIVAHDPNQVKVYCYADLPRPDEASARFRARADVWRETTRLTHERVTELVRQDQIDILVDLAGHIAGNRLGVFARKPAPVQVTYLGYQNTTGMTAMDYRLTDAHADPPDVADAHHTEQLVRLPGPFFCFKPPEPSPPVGPLPALGQQRVTFASLNHINKLTREAFRVWARILHGVPNSRLLVLAYTPGAFEDNARKWIAAEGIDPARIEVVNKRPRYEYLQMHADVDIALDSFPFNGHTTVCDALWMGVPSVMLEGDRYASRFGGSTLLAVGLDDWIGRSTEQYVEIALAAASDLDRLAALRATLRERLRQSPLVDAACFTRNVEHAYRQMWHAWCASRSA